MNQKDIATLIKAKIAIEKAKVNGADGPFGRTGSKNYINVVQLAEMVSYVFLKAENPHSQDQEEFH